VILEGNEDEQHCQARPRSQRGGAERDRRDDDQHRLELSLGAAKPAHLNPCGRRDRDRSRHDGNGGEQLAPTQNADGVDPSTGHRAELTVARRGKPTYLTHAIRRPAL
jgi:hypothetical protein